MVDYVGTICLQLLTPQGNTSQFILGESLLLMQILGECVTVSSQLWFQLILVQWFLRKVFVCEVCLEGWLVICR